MWTSGEAIGALLAAGATAQRLGPAVFRPTTPNPTSGFLLLVPEEDVMRLDLTVDEAAWIVISGGSIPMTDGRLRLPARPGRSASAARPSPSVGNAEEAAP